MTVPNEVEARIRRLALQNALDHAGAARPGPILARLLAQDPSLRSRASDLEPAVRAIVEEVDLLDVGAQARALEALGGAVAEPARTPGALPGELPPLPGAVPGKVVLRMAPFPSGALHIGNARMIFINDAYRRRYDGKLLLVFDDTIGSEEKRIDLEMFDLIRRDLETVGATPDATFYKSDRIPAMYPWARRVIDAGVAYVCRCPAATLRENRALGIACPERSESVGTTLDMWEGMLNNRFAVGEAVLRLKTDLHDPDPAFRDRVLFRLSDLDHPRVGQKYRVWPMLEFSWAVDDLELGITHVIRGKDLVIEDRMQQFIWNALGLVGPPFLHWGILRVREAKISKSKSYVEVKSGLFDGWADPKTWSIASLERRGIRPEALRRFTLSFGLSLADIEVPAETLYAENRQLIDGTTPRRSVVLDPVMVEVEGFPAELASVELANHPEHPEMGKRRVPTGPRLYLPRADLAKRLGEEIRLKDLANIELPRAFPDGTDRLTGRFTTRENKRIPRLQWVGAENAVPVDLLGVEGEHRPGLGEGELRSAVPGDVYQFERLGFVRIEPTWVRGSSPVRACFGHP
ncbi:MAG: glutamate--tRNA ligase [Thermoplasmata archaeon]